MSRASILEWERRWALPAALCAFAAAGFFALATVLSQSGPISPGSTTELLRDFHDTSGTLMIAAIVNCLALLLLGPPLYYLFQAALARSPRVRRGLVGVVIAGPVFLGLAEIFQWAALNAAANDFATPGGGAGIPIGDYADDLIRDQTTFNIAQGLSFAGVLGFVFGTVYTSLWAMRTGLLTRFMGTLGMALAASLVLLAQAFSLLALMLWFVYLAVIILDKVPRGRPPAWDAGEAVPWLRPGDDPVEPSEPGDEAVEGTATEIDEEPVNPNAGRRERAKKRKRKRRQ